MTKNDAGGWRRRAKWILIAAGFILLTTLAFGLTGVTRLSAGGFDAGGTESAEVTDALKREFRVGDADAVFLVNAKAGTVDDPQTSDPATDLARDLRARQGVVSVISYWENPTIGGLRSDDRSAALILVELTGSQNDKNTWLREAHDRYDRVAAIDVKIGGNAEVFRAIQDQITTDLIVAEGIAVTISMILLLFVFRSVVAAALPIAMGALSACVTLFVLSALTRFTEVSIFALNLTSALALGLGIDYGLLIVTRFREGLAEGLDTATAVARTMRTAGRTVIYSGITVALSLATLLLFPVPFLRSFGYAAVPSVAGAVLGATLVLPALLRLVGRNIDRWSLGRLPSLSPSEATWGRVARWALRFRFPVAAVLVAGLVVLAVPFLHVSIGKSDDRVLPAEAAVRTVQQELRDKFPGNTAFPVNVYLPDAGSDEAGRQEQRSMAERLSRLPHAGLVRGADGLWRDGRLEVPLPADTTMENSRGSYLSLLLKPDVAVYSPESGQTVDAIRTMTYAGRHPLVGGEPARMVDNKQVIGDRLPWAIGLIVAFALILTFLLIGSVVIPIKALFLNLLSLTATFGVMVWGFQDGHLEGLLGFTSSGYLDNAMPVLMFCAAFGLSMDYELFLVARISEEYRRSGDNNTAVVEGIKKTGAVFTSAALLLAVVFAGLIASKVSIIQMAGLGIVLAVLMDAILIRSLLVPALMGMMGRTNWWAPGPVRRLYDKVGISEEVGPRDPTERPADAIAGQRA